MTRPDPTIHIRVSPKLHAAIKKAAKEDMRSINAWVTIAIMEKLTRKEGK